MATTQRKLQRKVEVQRKKQIQKEEAREISRVRNAKVKEQAEALIKMRTSKKFFTDKSVPYEECSNKEWKNLYHGCCRGYPMCRDKRYVDWECLPFTGRWDEMYDAYKQMKKYDDMPMPKVDLDEHPFDENWVKLYDKCFQ